MIIIAVVLAMAIVAGYVEGYCWNGNCTSGSTENLTDSTQTPSTAPLTGVPSPEPTTAWAAAVAETVDYINYIRRSANMITYLPPSNLSAEEGPCSG